MSRNRNSDPFGDARRTGPRAWVERVARFVRDHRRVAQDSVGHVSHRLPTSLLVWVLIGIALALPGGLYLLQVNLAAIADQWQGRPGVSVYFRVGADADAAAALQRELTRDARVERVELVSADAALREFQAFAGVTDALAQLDRNPLPTSLKVLLVDGTAPAEFDLLAARIRAARGVDEVVIERTWLERLQAMTGFVRRLGFVLAALFAVGAVLVTATSVRLAIESRLEELKVMKLVGATDAYIRRPFLYFGLLYGLGGGVAAAMLISAVLLIVEPPLAALVGSYGTALTIEGFSMAFFGGLLLLGGALGVCGALLAARQRLADLEVV